MVFGGLSVWFLCSYSLWLNASAARRLQRLSARPKQMAAPGPPLAARPRVSATEVIGDGSMEYWQYSGLLWDIGILREVEYARDECAREPPIEKTTTRKRDREGRTREGARARKK